MEDHKYRDMAQNVAITLLAVLAVVLFTRTQLYSLGLDEGRVLDQSAQETGAVTAQAAQMIADAIAKYC